MNTPRCKECPYQAQIRSISKVSLFCKHSSLSYIKRITYSEHTRNTKSPKWCPLRERKYK